MPTSKPTQETEGKRPVDRLFKILATLHAELESLEDGVEVQLQDSVRATEAKLKALAAEEQQEMVRETEVAIRKQVSKDLLDRFAVETEVVKAEFEQRRNEEFETFKADVEEEKEKAIAAIKLEKELMAQERQAEAAQWNEERDRLKEQVTEATHLKNELTEKFEALEDQRNDEHDQEQERARVPQNGGNENMDFVRTEVSRVTSLLEDLAKEIENPSTDLSAGMRASRQQTELKAYLKGLRFALGEVEV